MEHVGLRPLLATPAVLDLAGGDVVLPACPPELEEPEGGVSQAVKQAKRQLKLFKSAAEGELSSRLTSFAQFVADPKAALPDVGKVLEGMRPGHHEAPASAPSLDVLAEALQVACGLLGRATQRSPPPEVVEVQNVLKRCLDLTKDMPRPLLREEALAAEHDKVTAFDARFHAFIVEVVQWVKQVPEGGMALLPAGWLCNSVSKEEEDADDSGHCVLLVLVRGTKDSSETCDLAVVNTGDGLQYHPVVASGQAPHPSMPLRDSLVLSGCSRAGLCSSGFWYLIYRQLLFPCDSNGPRFLYGVILPFANKKPLRVNGGSKSEKWTRPLPIPAGGDKSFALCVERALLLCFAAAGLSIDEASWWAMVRSRVGLLETIEEALPTEASKTTPGELALVHVAASALCRAAAEHAHHFGRSRYPAPAAYEEVRGLADRVLRKVALLEESGGQLQSAQPPPAAMPLLQEAATRFEHFERLVKEDVEKLKGEVDPPRILIPVLTSRLPVSIRTPLEAASCCRLTAQLLTLLINQQDQIAHAPASCFAVVAHLLTRLLPMPLPIDHPRKAELCFWAQDMVYETKADLMRHLYLIAARSARIGSSSRIQQAPCVPDRSALKPRSREALCCAVDGSIRMATSSERINSMFANSTTWRSKEEEQKGRAAIHASQVNRYSAANARAFASATASQEDLEAERQTSLKRRQKNEDEVAALLQEAQSAQSASLTLRLQATKDKSDKDKGKEKKLPGFVAVKKAKPTPAATSEGPADARHFAAAAFSLQENRETDGARVCVAGGLAAVMDALLRHASNFQGVSDQDASQVTLHYSGKAEGPTAMFGLDPGGFEKASESLLLVAPEYASLRSLVLDYFTSIRRGLSDDHVVFSFDRSMRCGDGDRKFIEQIGLSIGVPAARREAHLLITGERPELLELFLELGWFRDVVFLWKMLILPSGSGPPEGTWRATDSILQWSWHKDRFVVRGFNMELVPEEGKKGIGEVIKKPFDWLFGKYKSRSKAVSAADASVLAGSKIDTEDDVLFLEHTPDFNETLKPADSELLLTYLTAPYIRVPLLLGFFADRERVSLLREPLLQAVLDAALFEPGQWQSKQAAVTGPPSAVPAPDRNHLATPAGLLFNELLRSPRVLLDTIRLLLDVAVEKDPGHPGSANEGLILYLVRLATRVQAYLLFLVQHARTGAYLERAGAHWEAKVRGLPTEDKGQEILSWLQGLHSELRDVLEGKVTDMLLYWAKDKKLWNVAAKKKEDLLVSGCRAHAHLALIYGTNGLEFTSRSAAIFLSAQAFLNVNHRWFTKKDSTSTPKLGICEFELFDVFEGRRSVLAKWLREHKSDADHVLQRVEWVATFRGTIDGLDVGEDFQEMEWVELPAEPGDYVPKVAEPKPEWRQPQPGEDFQSWLTRVTNGPKESSGQISVNLGRYKVKGQGMSLIPEWAVENKDFQDAFGRADVHCSDIEMSAHRTWKRIVGHHHDLQRWEMDTRKLEDDPHSSLSGRLFEPAKLADNEKWLAHILSPLRISGRLHVQELSSDEARLILVVQVEESTHQLKEVLASRDPPVAEVYDIVEYGRQFYRSLAFCSDSRWSFSVPQDGEVPLYRKETASWSLATGSLDKLHPPAPSILIYRQVVANLGRQLFMPSRFLLGLVPSALLERYSFWRSDGAPDSAGCLTGDELQPCDGPTRLQVTLCRGKMGVSATVRRVCLKPSSGPYHSWDADDSKAAEVLVNLRHSSSLKFASLLARIEDLSHILAWSSEEGGRVRRVEFPRLWLSFQEHGGHLYCEQHSGFWLAECKWSNKVCRLLQQFGGGTLLLENGSGEYAILVSAAAQPVRPSTWAADGTPEKLLPGQLAFRRGREEWLQNLDGPRHYRYDVHFSQMFIFTPTLAAGLYFLLCRFMTWHFAEAVSMAETITEVCTEEEKQLWDAMKALEPDCHADAIACRLHLSMAISPYAVSLPWSTAGQFLEYTRKRHLVSTSCALSLKQELAVLKLDEVRHSKKFSKLKAYQSAVQALAACKEGKVLLPVDLGPLADDSGFDRVVDRSFLKDLNFFEKIAASAKGVAYNRPKVAAMVGIDGMRFLNDLFGGIRGGCADVPLFFLYELFTGTISVEMVNKDNQQDLASLLLRVIAGSQTGAEWSVLRALERNPQVCSCMPQWGSDEAKRSWALPGGHHFDHNSVSTLMKAASNKLKSLEKDLCIPNFAEAPQIQTSLAIEDAAGFSSSIRFQSPPLTADVRCCSRASKMKAEISAKQPLASLSKYLERTEDRERKAPGLNAVGSSLEVLARGPCAQTDIGRTGIQRCQQEVQTALSEEVTVNLSIDPSKLALLEKELRKVRDEDRRALSETVDSLVIAANAGSDVDWLGRHCGHVPRLDFSDLLRVLMAEEPHSTDALQRANPMLKEGDMEALMEKAVDGLCRGVRIGQACRSLALVTKLSAALARATKDSTEVAVLQAQLAAQLRAERFFCKVRSQMVCLDPRLLVFEFLCNILLREGQVRLLGTFLHRAAGGQSLCHQMIMGAGKTTVITPLLVLLLANSQRLVCACMPAALLEMSRAVLIERFSSPAMMKAVLTLQFDRVRSPSSRLCGDKHLLRSLTAHLTLSHVFAVCRCIHARSVASADVVFFGPSVWGQRHFALRVRMDESWNPVSLDVPIMGSEEGLAPCLRKRPKHLQRPRPGPEAPVMATQLDPATQLNDSESPMSTPAKKQRLSDLEFSPAKADPYQVAPSPAQSSKSEPVLPSPAKSSKRERRWRTRSRRLCPESGWERGRFGGLGE
eukprot:s1679_g9.t2